MTGHPAHVKDDADRAAASWVQRVAEAIAGFLGTGRYLALQTGLVICWVTYNVSVASGGLRFDPYPFILLNLAFSTQASYAAPLILLAANRQAALDRARADHDHAASEENLRLTREIHRKLDAGSEVGG